MMRTSASEHLSARAAATPPKPPPRTTTRFALMSRFRAPPISSSRTQLQQAEQYAVTFCRQCIHRAPAGLIKHTRGDGLAKLRREFGISQHLPPCRHGACELIEEMFDASLAPAEVKQKSRPHYT